MKDGEVILVSCSSATEGRSEFNKNAEVRVLHLRLVGTLQNRQYTLMRAYPQRRVDHHKHPLYHKIRFIGLSACFRVLQKLVKLWYSSNAGGDGDC